MNSHDAGGTVLQQRTLAAYLAMCANGESWTRRLVMIAASADAAPFALAAMAAGGTVLWVCSREAHLRESSLSGLTDFQVTTLGEALRILKNEIRKGLPVSVGVLDTEGEVWAEAVRRGVQPEAMFAQGRDARAAAMLAERGAQLLVADGAAPTEVHVARTWRDRREGDAEMVGAAQEMGGPDRAVALRWLRSAPRLFPRCFSRWYATGWQLHPKI